MRWPEIYKQTGDTNDVEANKRRERENNKRAEIY